MSVWKVWKVCKVEQYTVFTLSVNGNCFNQTNGNNCIRKEGDQLTFYFWGYHSLSVPELKTVEAAKIQISIGGLGAYNCMTRNCIGAFTFDKLHVDAFQDEPNRYGNGDVVRVDGNTNKVYVNGLVRMNDEIRGADYFHAQSGETDVEFVFSDWIVEQYTVFTLSVNRVVIFLSAILFSPCKCHIIKIQEKR